MPGNARVNITQPNSTMEYNTASAAATREVVPSALQRAQKKDSSLFYVAPGVIGLRIWFVNVYLVSESETPGSPWILIDAGLVNSNTRIREAAESIFGVGARPSAIVLTHGHYDHVGALHQLAVDWNVPVYAHLLELPYLTGRSDYPPADPSVGGGAMTWLSWLYPNGPINLGDRVVSLPAGGTVPELPGWRWIHTPGHAPGHVSFFRDGDRTLISGDAFVTTNQESFLSVIRQTPEIHRPPAYFTPNWRLARQSVRDLADLQPEIVASGHGQPMRGETMRQELETLADRFEEIAVPAQGRYVAQPARVDEQGAVIFVPPAVESSVPKLAIGLGLALVAAAALFAYIRDRKETLEVQGNRLH
jgi:glyoxylase-like metal-dependent hydrolase (beta-lactamase superfamily II)